MAAPGSRAPALTARAAGLVGCRVCGLVAAGGTARCPRCGAALHSRKPASLVRVWAWLIAGLIAYVPANVYPMLVTTTLGFRRGSTIVGGIGELARAGVWDVAVVVAVASVLIPVTKFIAIAYLALSMRPRPRPAIRTRLRLYRLVELVGRWSMIDVFVVAILAALVQWGFFVRIDPGPAAAFYALSVACTMLAAQALDPRLIWDAAER